MHQAFIIEGVDEAVIRAQAYRRANPKLEGPLYPRETTAIHHHKQGEHCNELCYVIQPMPEEES